MYKFEQINLSNIHLLKEFISVLGEGVKSFRYFDKRPFEIALTHYLSVVMVDDKSKPVVYGHLEKEGDTLWLGIAVAEKEQGTGLGKKMLNYIINYARVAGKDKITLTVDKSNYKAIKLYENHDFVRTAEKGYFYQYDCHLK